jgi:dienelactone hydrolase
MASPQIAHLPLSIPVDGIELDATLARPADARGLIVFAHGSGSSQRSPRNQRVSSLLAHRGLATLLVDLATPVEEEREELDVTLHEDSAVMAERLIGVIDWTRADPRLRALPLGLYGAATGAAAALIAAARRPEHVHAVVTRGGRPALAGSWLAHVHAPTLMIVGGADADVLVENRAAARALGGPHEVAIVPGAGHLFAELGALDEVARQAGDFFFAQL